MAWRDKMAYRLLKTMLFSSIFVLVLGCWTIAGTAMAEGPSFDCSKASGSIEELICKDKELSSLDHELAGVYAEAIKIATSQHPLVCYRSPFGGSGLTSRCAKVLSSLCTH